MMRTLLLYSLCFGLVFVVGCNSVERNMAGPANEVFDHYVGWYTIQGGGYLPIIKRYGNYYTTSRGFEVPLKQDMDGTLLWGITPSSMTGTRIGCKRKGEIYFLQLYDEMLAANSDSKYGVGEVKELRPCATPGWLKAERASRPGGRDGFAGVYEPVYFPYYRYAIDSDGMGYVCQMMQRDENGGWSVIEEPWRLKMTMDGKGVLLHENENARLMYNDFLGRYEVVMGSKTMVMTCPLAKLVRGNDGSGEMVLIGVPAWH